MNQNNPNRRHIKRTKYANHYYHKQSQRHEVRLHTCPACGKDIEPERPDVHLSVCHKSRNLFDPDHTATYPDNRDPAETPTNKPPAGYGF